MTRHPLFADLQVGKDYRVVGELKNTDKIMNDSFWIGVYPGMSAEKIKYIIDVIVGFVASK